MSTPQQRIEIVNEPKGSKFLKLKINGHEVHDVRSISFNACGYTKIPTVTISLAALDLRIDTPCVLTHESLGNIKTIVFENESGLGLDKVDLKQKGEE